VFRSRRSPERLLATILFTDIVGSTELAVRLGDESWQRLVAAHHAAVRRELRRFRGRELDTAGDGFFAAFDQPAQAVRAADAIVAAVSELGVSIRAGLHAGETEASDGKLGGIAVHIASRVMSAAEPGEVLVSSTLRDLVTGSGLEFRNRGLQELKGVPGEWHLWALVREATDATQDRFVGSLGVAEGTRPRLPLPDKPSIAVLPFTNLSGDPEQDYFADGVVEDIITGLSRIKWIFVIARNSSFAYRGKAVDVKQVGRELGVRYVLEGSVRKSGNRVRITAQLIDAETGTHIWADQYDHALDDIFAVQDELTITVVGVIDQPCAKQRSSAPGACGPTAWTRMTFISAHCRLPSRQCRRTPTRP
jgi:adenylate cyclase